MAQAYVCSSQRFYADLYAADVRISRRSGQQFRPNGGQPSGIGRVSESN